ncbi:hypothetical protein [Aeromicrobium sp.]|uniref:hypothetical protein n=1 Tax=Aeromicrobium sp. TaxID=1871063 RepID=UPI0028AE157E|nr:hypothetical protein [Aeromicrobium sp.]
MSQDPMIRPIGPRGVLLHVGPHKTGTTAIQGALAAVRDELAALGVLYPGQTRSQANAGRVASGFASPIGTVLPPQHHWDDLVDEVRAAPGRVVISSEYFDVVRSPRTTQIAERLGVERLDVVVTAAPLASVMPSSWQQAVRSNLRLTFDDWLHTVFDEPDGRDAAVFWLRQRIDDQVRRWAEVVGPERVHVVVTDKRRPRRLFDSFEDLLGLPRDLLQSQSTASNRSFTAQEIELVRRVNERIKARGWSPAIQARFVRLGAVRQLRGRRPRPDEARVAMPDWAVERANDAARTMISGIVASGADVIGDLDALITAPADVGPMPAVTTVDMDVAVRAVIGAMRGGGADLLREKYATAETVNEYPGVSSAPTELLRAELARRGVDTDESGRGRRPRRRRSATE